MESERELLYCYKKFNHLFYGDELTDNILIYYDAIGKAYGDCANLDLGGAWSKLDSGEFVIRVNPAVRGWKALRNWVVLHEMAHIHIYPNRNHGKKFQAEMLRLAQIGAFKDVW